MLRDHCPVCLSVTLVYCGQTVGWIKVPLSMEVGLGPGNIVLDRDPAASAKKGQSRSPKKEGTAPPPNFSAHIYCCQMAGWIRIPLGTEDRPLPWWHYVRWGPSSPHGKGTAAPHFLAHVYCAKWSPISATAELSASLVSIPLRICGPRFRWTRDEFHNGTPGDMTHIPGLVAWDTVVMYFFQYFQYHWLGDSKRKTHSNHPERFSVGTCSNCRVQSHHVCKQELSDCWDGRPWHSERWKLISMLPNIPACTKQNFTV